MSRSVLCPLMMAFFLTGQVVMAEEQDAIATVKPSSSKGNSETAAALFQSIDQLLHVADQLERDGHADEAARVRAEARELALKENILARKEAELECLQDQVDRLRTLTGDTPNVMVRLIAFELVRSRLGDRAAEFDKLLGIEPTPGKDGSGKVTHAADQVRTAFIPSARIRTDSPLFEELKSRKAISIIAEPTLITTDGRPASFFSGGQIEVPLPIQQAEGKPVVQLKNHGIQFETVPTVRPGGRIRLQVKFEQSEPDFANVVAAGGMNIPAITSRSINTEIEVHSGQTVRICGLISSRTSGKPQGNVATQSDELAKGVRLVGSAPVPRTVESALAETDTDAESRELVVLVTPEFVHLPATGAQLQPVPAEEEVEILRKALVPTKLAEDIQYFPATPIPRKGTLK